MREGLARNRGNVAPQLRAERKLVIVRTQYSILVFFWFTVNISTMCCWCFWSYWRRVLVRTQYSILAFCCDSYSMLETSLFSFFLSHSVVATVSFFVHSEWSFSSTKSAKAVTMSAKDATMSAKDATMSAKGRDDERQRTRP